MIIRPWFAFPYLATKSLFRQAKHPLSTMVKSLVAVCQMTSTSDKNKNYEILSSLVLQAKQRNACMAFFPEACDYLADNKKDIIAFAERIDGPTVSSYQQLASRHSIWLSLGGIHEKEDENSEKICNTHVLIDSQGTLVAAYRKVHLFDMENKDIGVRLMESDYVKKGNKITPPIITPAGILGLSIVSFSMFHSAGHLSVRPNRSSQIMLMDREGHT